MSDLKDGNQVEEDVVLLRRSYVYAILLPMAFALGLGVGYIAWGTDKTEEPVVTDTPVAVVTEEPEIVRYDVPVDDDPYLGPEDAPITIIEFSDFNCGYCRKWYVETLGPIMEEFPDQVRFVYRDFPLLSESSLSAAHAAQCAHEQDAFWDFHDALFLRDEPKEWDSYLKFAEEFNLNLDDFEECFESERTIAEVENDARYAAGIGIQGTPTFFVNGLALVGAQPFELFKQIIEDELAGIIGGE
jgi:protein-disulfide isomerase